MRSVLRPLAVAMLLLTAASCRTVGAGNRERGGFAEIRPTVAQQMILDNRTIILFDVRPDTEYVGSLGHIAGALSVPLDRIETRLPELVPYQTGTVIIYADDEEESKRGARLLVAAGFQNVVRIKGGIREWIDLGYKTVLSP